MTRRPAEYEIDLDPPTSWISRLVMIAVLLLIVGVVVVSYWFLNRSEPAPQVSVDFDSLPNVSVDDICGRMAPPRGVNEVQQWMQAVWKRFCG